MVDFHVLDGRADFWFMRHGESEGNREGRMQGRRHSRLSDAGRAQSRGAGRWLAGRGIVRVLTSPLQRAQETAAIAAAAAGLPAPETVDDLTEIDIGLFTDLTLPEAASRHPEHHHAFLRESWEGVPGSERTEELYARALRVWGMLLARAAAGERSVLCVTHGGSMSRTPYRRR